MKNFLVYCVLMWSWFLIMLAFDWVYESREIIRFVETPVYLNSFFVYWLLLSTYIAKLKE